MFVTLRIFAMVMKTQQKAGEEPEMMNGSGLVETFREETCGNDMGCQEISMLPERVDLGEAAELALNMLGIEDKRAFECITKNEIIGDAFDTVYGEIRRTCMHTMKMELDLSKTNGMTEEEVEQIQRRMQRETSAGVLKIASVLVSEGGVIYDEICKIEGKKLLRMLKTVICNSKLSREINIRDIGCVVLRVMNERVPEFGALLKKSAELYRVGTKEMIHMLESNGEIRKIMKRKFNAENAYSVGEVLDRACAAEMRKLVEEWKPVMRKLSPEMPIAAFGNEMKIEPMFKYYFMGVAILNPDMTWKRFVGLMTNLVLPCIDEIVYNMAIGTNGAGDELMISRIVSLPALLGYSDE